MLDKVVKKNINSINLTILFFSVIILFFPFFRGLYFEREFYVASMIMSVMAAIVFFRNIKNKEKIKFYSPIEYFATAFVLIYLFTFPFSVNEHLASFEIIKNLTYFIFFIVIVYNLKTDKDISLINWSLILIGTIASIIGLGSALGTFSYKGAFVDGMINSTFQYHNTFGAYMLAVLFLAMGEIAGEDNLKKYLLSGFSYVVFSGFILSYSRGAWILLPIVGIIAFILLKTDGLKRVLISFIAIIFSFSMTISHIYQGIKEQNSFIGWLSIVIGIAITAMIIFLLDKLLNKLPKINIKKRTIVIVLLISLVIILILFVNGVLIEYLPHSIAERVKGINLKTFTVVERGVFYKDALKIIKDYPIIGVGGGGWQTLYSMYKTYDYTTTQAHNYIIQTWIEIGTLGLIILIGLYLSTLWSSYRIIKSINNDKLFNKMLGIICATLVLILHSTIDFDMSLGAYAFFVWAMLGTIVAVEKRYVNKYSKTAKKLTISFIVPMLLSIVLLFTSGMFHLGYVNAMKAVESVKNKDYVKAQEYFERAARQNPFIANYKFDLGTIQYNIGINLKSKELIEKSKQNIENAIRLNERDFKILANSIAIYLRRGDIDKGEELLQKLQKYHPLNDHTYISSIEIYYNIGHHYLKKGNIDKAKDYFKKVISINEEVIQKNQELEKIQKELLKDINDIPSSYVEERFKINLDQKSIQLVNSAKDILNKLK
ncbi:O-antigen ligase family protein [Caloranaerobacter azorensis]|uniref:Tetratricopeptide repeat protein n=1 Tax=Caloranaerobacter azorensis TaxID=116090 RepID=A0A6P1YF88_9FIRM|nr:O-antigen ligase family protein [Caloranaerobacter azorensis]QIB27592.1 tetratricopeptide repeat protein [Caloranaerobacter azorensis]